MPTKLIVGNWKMYPTLSDSLVLASVIKRDIEEVKGVEVVIAPPVAWLVPIIEQWRHKPSHLKFAAQNIWPQDQGAYTGEISSYMLKDVVNYAIVGHSERRSYQKENNDLVQEKVQSALGWGITPIICVGEKKKIIKSDGQIDQYQWQELSAQLTEALVGLDDDQLAKVVIAYEPVWAIGNNNPASAEYSADMIGRLKKKLLEKFDPNAVERVRWLYGGSVSPTSASSFLAFRDIDGLLIGTESVKARNFLSICHLAAKATLGR
jgi:triosephosphate isomerase